MAEKLLISADSHVSEPPDLWVERIDKPFRDRAPRVVMDYEGQQGEYFVFEGGVSVRVAQGLLAAAVKEETRADFAARSANYADALPGGWDPVERLKDQDIDGVECEVLYTTLGFRLYWLTDPAFQQACFRTYNDWLAEYCSHSTKRLVGIGLISLHDPAEGVKELQRCVEMGLKGGLVWNSPPEGHSFSTTEYDTFWAAAQEMGIPITLHSIAGNDPENHIPPGPWTGIMSGMVQNHVAQRALTNMIMSGLLERFPRLKLVIAEFEAGWLSFFLHRLDLRASQGRGLPDVTLSLKPSEYFRRQVHAAFINDPVAVQTRHMIGVDRLMWSSDYPHGASTWPNSREIMGRYLEGVPEDEQQKLLRDNAIELYGLDVA